MPKTPREIAHDFAVNYRVESRESRNEDIDKFFSALAECVPSDKELNGLIIDLWATDSMTVAKAIRASLLKSYEVKG